MSVYDKIEKMLDGGEIDSIIALRLILELLLEDTKRLTAVVEYQEDNPSLVWFFRHRPKIAVPLAVTFLLSLGVLFDFVTADILAKFIAGLFGISL